MSKIVVIGSLNMDLVVRVEQMPLPGQTVPGGDLQTICGGKGANQAVAAARLGSQVAMVGRVGSDAFGTRLVDNLGQAGVDTSHVLSDGSSVTGTAVIVVDQKGENSIVISSGANGRVSEDDIRAAEGLIDRAEYLLLQFELPMETVESALRLASRYPVKVILNPAPARLIPPAALAGVEFFVPNETEASFLTGVEVKDLLSAGEAARVLLGYGVQNVLITLGEKGAMLATRDEIVHIPTRKVKAVDTTAAGDAFIGGLATALSQGYSLKDAVRFANCAGALAATRFGAQTSLPTWDEVHPFFLEASE